MTDQRLEREAFPAADRSIVAEEDSCGTECFYEGFHDGIPHGLEARRQHLNHEPAVVAIHHQRRKGVSLSVNEPKTSSIDVLPSGGGGSDLLPPPGQIDGTVASLQQPEPDLRMR
jgi:hypothetical protein